MSQGIEGKEAVFVGFHTDPEQKARIKDAAARSDRTVASWLRSRLDHLFEIDDQLRDRRPTLSQ